MLRVLLILDDMKLQQSAMEFALYIAKATQSKLTAVFLENLKYLLDPEFTGERAVGEKSSVQNNINIFRSYCAQNDVLSDIIFDKGVPIDKAIEESLFADIVILDSRTSFAYVQEAIPTHFVRHLLAKTNCPVIIAPERFAGIDEIVFTYDGSNSSILAIKQFTYLFPQFAAKTITALRIYEGGKEDGSEGQISKWFEVHYPAVSYHIGFGDAEEELFKKYLGHSNKMIVMGAYGRSSLSKLLNHSTADTLLKAADTPVFIYHS